jgi:hypothetical protein
MSPLLVLAGVGVLTVAATLTLAVLIIGIRREDRRYRRGKRYLISAPRSSSELFARRVLSGSRSPEPPARSDVKRWPYA